MSNSTSNKIELEINAEILKNYEAVYFKAHPRARKPPIARPYHESINQWMILKRMQMNALKQKWKDFICWFVRESGYGDAMIERCKIKHTIFYPTRRRHDVDNTTPKFILDGFVESGMIVDDDYLHITELTLRCGIDKENPRTEIEITILNE